MRKHREFLFPDLTPLIDVVFLLLIFFLVSSVFKKEDVALLLNLPTSKYAEIKLNEKDINLYLTSEKIAFNDEEIDISTLDNELSQIINKNTLINFRIDKEVKYERIVLLFDLLKKYELSNLALASEKDEWYVKNCSSFHNDY